jgi:hypothetical protein
MTFADALNKIPVIDSEFFVETPGGVRIVFRQFNSRDDRETVLESARQVTDSVKKGLDPLGGFQHLKAEVVFPAMIAHQLFLRTEIGGEVSTDNSQRAWLEFAGGPKFQVFDNVVVAMDDVVHGKVKYAMVKAIEDAEKNS